MSTSVAPADTRMMAVVHRALTRDLQRVGDAVTAKPYPQGRRRQALGEHVAWLMRFLHEHHTGEDEGLWPMVRDRNPDAGPLLESLEADHRAIAPAAERLAAAGQAYSGSTGDVERVEVHDALQALTSVLVPHLEREVAEAMPVVSASITHADWHAWDQERNVKGKPLSELGFVGHWLLDGIDPEGYQLVVGEVPAVPRFILLRFFAGPYRRRADLLWRAGE
ncbi:hemerythrin domain-containing protein [Dactylosporangium sp. NPDC048998]|uniref:hemerythrin domain-containing protein n=1 Tax=Dactylosporangium sp. NPDC048998 TaxID=3363976 RepID=UPI0037141467